MEVAVLFNHDIFPAGGITVLLAVLFFASSVQGRKTSNKPPTVEKKPKEIVTHGDRRVDDYFWLREKENPQVLAYLEAENSYADAMMADTEKLQEKLYNELVSRIQETDLDAPVRKDNYFYYTRTEKGKQYPIYCRKLENMDAEEEIILDQNKLSEGLEFCNIGAFSVSPNHKLLAYSLDATGAELYTLHVKNLETGELLKDEIKNTYSSIQWANDNQTLFYATLDEARRPDKAFRHRLGALPEKDELVLHETDDSYYLSISKTRSKKFILLNLHSKVTSEVRVLDADNPDAELSVIEPRKQDVEYEVEHHQDQFFILTNLNAKNFQIMTAPVSSPGQANWKTFIEHNPDIKLDGVYAFSHHLVIAQRENGLEHLLVRNLDNNQEHRIQTDETAYSIWANANPMFDTQTFRFGYTSLVTPLSIYDYDLNSRARELMKQKEVLGGYDKSNYVVERLTAKAKDGVSVPISIVYKKGMQKDGTAPLYLYAYGSYGATIDPGFRSTRISLLDRGVVFAIAHIRGGGAMGRDWYENGKYLKKKNTFTDFIASAEHLIAEKYTNPQKLIISGGSAGGLLMGAVINMRPELFHAAIASVPFVDVLNTMLDPTIPLTVIEYEEWGNPNNEEYYHYMKSYSPYDNVEAKNYPNILITAGLNDSRVQYWEPAKWTAKLRALKTDSNVLLLKTEMGAGHGGPSGRYDYLKKVAFEFAFVFDLLKFE